MAKRKVATSIVVKKELKKVFNKTVEIPDGLITNEAIRQKFAEYLKQSNYIPSSALTPINRLIDEQVIIPVNIKKKGWLSFLNNQLKNKVIMPFSYYDGVLAFYSGLTNRIYMLIDNIQKYHTSSTANHIAKTLVHELQHMQCNNFPHEFYNVHKNEISKFYSEFFRMAASTYGISSDKLPVNEGAATFFAKTILYIFDHLLSDPSSIITKNDLMAYNDKCYNVYANDKSSKSAQKMAGELANIITTSALGILTGKYYSNCKNYSSSPERLCYISLYKTYNKLFGSAEKYGSFFGQELIFLSELISVLSQDDNSSKMFAFINRL